MAILVRGGALAGIVHAVEKHLQIQEAGYPDSRVQIK